MKNGAKFLASGLIVTSVSLILVWNWGVDVGCQYRIAGWLQAENFENSAWKTAEVIPVRVLQWFSQTHFACFGSTK